MKIKEIVDAVFENMQEMDKLSFIAINKMIFRIFHADEGNFDYLKGNGLDPKLVHEMYTYQKLVKNRNKNEHKDLVDNLIQTLHELYRLNHVFFDTTSDKTFQMHTIASSIEVIMNLK